ncbi:MAG: flagellar basal body-associated FliL family protein [Pseudomonadales bacterium]|nr:flagellar basal body-associated FliL family protein [Pseudomonadales bacterium]
MADDEIQNAPQATAGKAKLIIIITVIVVLLGGAGAAAFFLLASPEQSAVAEGDEAAVEVAVAKAPAQYVKLKPITVNFTEKKKQRFVQISPSLMTRDPEMVAAIEENIPLIENNLLMLFASQDFADLKTRAGRVKLREQALVEVQKIMHDEVGKDAVERVLFTGFIIQ